VTSQRFSDQQVISTGAGSLSKVSSSSLLYLYGVLEDTAIVHDLFESKRMPGLEPNEPLFSLEHHGLVAAVSRVPFDIFEEGPLNALLSDLPRLAQFAVQHEEAVRSLLASASALVPMAFGTVYRGPEGIIKLLEEKEAQFKSLLDQVRNKQEWGIKIVLDNESLLTAVEDASEEIKQLVSEASAATPGRAYLLSKQKERILTTEAQRLLREWLDTIVENLESASYGIVVDDLPPIEGAKVSIILKAAFLVAEEQVETFREKVRELAHLNSSRGLSIDLNGPWAAYSFVRGLK